MPNASVYTGADGSITLAKVEGTEGDKANAILEAYTTDVGRVQNVQVQVRTDVRAFHEIGERYATEMRSGNVHITGTIGRAHINGALLKLMLGEAGKQRQAGNWAQPAFNITLLLTNSTTADASSTLTLHDVKIDQWLYTIPEDDFVLESVGFQALYLTVDDGVEVSF